ncbi:hypothetical protein [Rosenbergiella australiborealis]|uniref:hypothetical protein n=1 Tax=Rosenbergiella australiborealis TaxID=1544696 RepID=UPI001F4EDE04|nr:hypothetical protein [Rosenbergiella australiborealis]
MTINQQSSWGGKRKGSGAPMGNTNAVKHGERSGQAFFPLVVPEHFTAKESNRARNLILAKRWAELYAMNPPPRTEHYREMMLINGLMGQHTDRIITQTIKAGR